MVHPLVVMIIGFWLCFLAYQLKGFDTLYREKCETAVWATSTEVESCVEHSWYWTWK